MIPDRWTGLPPAVVRMKARAQEQAALAAWHEQRRMEAEWRKASLDAIAAGRGMLRSDERMIAP